MTRGSRAEAHCGPAFSASTYIERNFSISNSFPFNPVRVCWNNAGPRLSSRTVTATNTITGKKTTSRHHRHGDVEQPLEPQRQRVVQQIEAMREQQPTSLRVHHWHLEPSLLIEVGEVVHPQAGEPGFHQLLDRSLRKAATWAQRSRRTSPASTPFRGRPECRRHSEGCCHGSERNRKERKVRFRHVPAGNPDTDEQPFRLCPRPAIWPCRFAAADSATRRAATRVPRPQR